MHNFNIPLEFRTKLEGDSLPKDAIVTRARLPSKEWVSKFTKVTVYLLISSEIGARKASKEGL